MASKKAADITGGRRSILIGLLAGSVICGSTSVAGEKNEKQQGVKSHQWLIENPLKIPAMLQRKEIALDAIPNPHQGRDGCFSCHNKKAGTPSAKTIKRQISKTCSACHDKLSAHTYIHPSGLRPTKKFRKLMNKDFRQAVQRASGTASCTVCHDLTLQCLPQHKNELSINPRFFRNGPYRKRSKICYQCHNRKAYQRLNPHDQINEQGHIRTGSCALCHADTNKLDAAKDITQVDFNVQGNLSAMCTGCHLWRPHPGGAFNLIARGKAGKVSSRHLVKPSEMTRRYMQQQNQKHSIVLPLEPDTGKVFCGTCHNPHEKGVIKVAEAAHGADEKNRLRKQGICTHCHDK